MAIVPVACPRSPRPARARPRRGLGWSRSGDRPLAGRRSTSTSAASAGPRRRALAIRGGVTWRRPGSTLVAPGGGHDGPDPGPASPCASSGPPLGQLALSRSPPPSAGIDRGADAVGERLLGGPGHQTSPVPRSRRRRGPRGDGPHQALWGPGRRRARPRAAVPPSPPGRVTRHRPGVRLKASQRARDVHPSGAAGPAPSWRGPHEAGLVGHPGARPSPWAAARRQRAGGDGPGARPVATACARGKAGSVPRLPARRGADLGATRPPGPARPPPQARRTTPSPPDQATVGNPSPSHRQGCGWTPGFAPLSGGVAATEPRSWRRRRWFVFSPPGRWRCRSWCTSPGPMRGVSGSCGGGPARPAVTGPWCPALQWGVRCAVSTASRMCPRTDRCRRGRAPSPIAPTRPPEVLAPPR